MKSDIVIIGAGAAGLAAAIFAGEELRAARSQLRVVMLDSARKIGAKILVSGGGRCNVTHCRVTPEDYNGGPRIIIAKVLRAFDEHRTLEWMKALGVPLKLEPTGKYFPVGDSARSVLDALVDRVQQLGVELRTGIRVDRIARTDGGFELLDNTGRVLERCRTLIVCTGGLALPKSGSDGTGLAWMRELGHTVHSTTPALAPLVLAHDHTLSGCLHELSGITLDLHIALRDESGKILAEQTGSTVITHFGLSGPAPMNLSRHIARWRLQHPNQRFSVTVGHPELRARQEADQWLLQETSVGGKRLCSTALQLLFPERYADLIASEFGRLADLSRTDRLELASRIAALPVNVTGDRGYTYAETTAGGVDLREVDSRTMESRIVPGLYLCGEILDVDGRIGGFCFQWAWATGYLAGRAAAGRTINL